MLKPATYTRKDHRHPAKGRSAKRVNALPALHVAARIFNTPLLIHPQKAEVIIAAIGSRIGLRAVPVLAFDDDEMFDGGTSSPVSGERPDLCVVPIYGTLAKRATGMDAMSGGLTSYSDIQSQIAAALADDACKALVLDVDSPGGEASGMFDLADYISSVRGQKPIVAVANDSAYSAAYCLAACADKLLVTSVGGVGSIGCYMLHCDMSKADSNDGLKYTYIFAGDRKVDGNPHQPLSDAAMDEFTSEVNRIRAMFVQSVSRGRSVDAQALLDTQAACFMGASAVPLLADGVGTLADAIDMARGMSAAARSVAMPRDAASRKTAAGACKCACKPCADGNCAKCCAAKCDDQKCAGCPMQGESRKTESQTVRSIAISEMFALLAMPSAPPCIDRQTGPNEILALRRSGTLALAGDPTKQKVAGILAPYNSLSTDLGGFREIYEPGCFSESLRSGDDARVLFNHNVDFVLGRKSANTARFWEEADGLHYEADLPDTQVARDLVVSMRRGDIRESSAAFYILSHRWEQRSGVRTRIIERAKLVEGSPHSFAAYEASTAAPVESPQAAIAASINEVELSGARLQLLKIA